MSVIYFPLNHVCSFIDCKFHIIQILTVTVMKYHVSVDCQELYFPKGLYFPEARSAEGKYNHKGKYNYLGTTDT